jgi:hypothetical protein
MDYCCYCHLRVFSDREKTVNASLPTTKDVKCHEACALICRRLWPDLNKTAGCLSVVFVVVGLLTWTIGRFLY